MILATMNGHAPISGLGQLGPCRHLHGRPSSDRYTELTGTRDYGTKERTTVIFFYFLQYLPYICLSAQPWFSDLM